MAAGNRKKHLEFTFARFIFSFELSKFRQMFILILFEDTEQLCHNHPPDVTHDEN